MIETNQSKSNNAEIFSGTVVVWVIFGLFVAFFVWSYSFTLDQFVRAQFKVFSESRTQVIQSVDGGVLEAVYVKEGDRVEKGQILVKINAKRFRASSNEIQARVDGLRAKIVRLTAEIERAEGLEFPIELLTRSTELVEIERTLFNSRRSSLNNDVAALRDNLRLATSEKEIVDSLRATGDVDQLEVLNAEKSVIDARAKLRTRINEYNEQASTELAEASDNLSQATQVLSQRTDLVESSDVIAQTAGFIKNINATTIGAVLQAGEQLMEIIPLDDELLLEAKIAPVDIADLSLGQPATVRLDPYDSSIYGTVSGKVRFISGDTIVEEEGGQGQEQTFYQVHVALDSNPIVTSIGQTIQLIPGMTGHVDIKTGNRSVLTYLLKPITKTLEQSFGER